MGASLVSLRNGVSVDLYSVIVSKQVSPVRPELIPLAVERVFWSGSLRCTVTVSTSGTLTLFETSNTFDDMSHQPTGLGDAHFGG